MSTPGGGGASRGIKAKPTPPLKGSFPLDHFGECKKLMVAYNKCMKARTPPQLRAAAPLVLVLALGLGLGCGRGLAPVLLVLLIFPLR